MCNNDYRCPAGRLTAHPCWVTSRVSVRDARRRGYKREYAAADVRTLSIRSCCPGFGRRTRAAGRKEPLIGTTRRHDDSGHVKRVPPCWKQMLDEAERLTESHAILTAKARPGDRAESQQPQPRLNINKLHLINRI